MKKGTKKWITFDFESKPTGNISPTPSRNSHEPVRLPQDEVFKSSSITIAPKKNINFLEKLKPKSVDDLAVHSKKVKDVELWLQENVLAASDKCFAPMLLLTGPTGSGKTATVNVLAKTMGLKLLEWVNPVDQHFEFGGSEAQMGRFVDFFTQAKYTSLCEDIDSKKVALIEDFPNFVTYNPSEFISILEKCHTGSTPIIFICTDASSSKLDLSQKLFPQEVKQAYSITTISFNPCSATLLKNILKKAQNLTQDHPDLFRTLSSDVTEAIVASAMGDIRSALNQYHFACLKGLGNIPMSDLNQSHGKKRKRGTKPSPSIKSMAKDETLGFFHGLGRVLNPKRIEANGSWRLQCDFDALIDQFGTQPSNFNAFLQENYLNYFGDFGDAQKASDVLSEAQIFLNQWTERGDILLYALWIAVLGLMVFNEHRVCKWNQIKGPNKSKRVIDDQIETRHISKMDSSYYNIITNSSKFHSFKL